MAGVLVVSHDMMVTHSIDSSQITGTPVTSVSVFRIKQHATTTNINRLVLTAIVEALPISMLLQRINHSQGDVVPLFVMIK